ncbi:MAG: hypothetical protein ACNA8W_22800, partial [Bradymonadaceae bacterium]
MGNRVGVQTRRATVGPMAFGPDPGDSFLVALAAERGPANVPTLITGMSRFTALFGGATPFLEGARYSDGYEVLKAFFNKSGRRAYVLRVVSGDAVTANVELVDRQAIPGDTLKVSGKGPGTWASDFQVKIENGTKAGTFRLIVIDSSDGDDDVETFDNLTLTASSLATVNVQSELINVEDMGSDGEGVDALPALGTFDLDGTVAGVDGNDLTSAEVIGEQVADGSKTGLFAFRSHAFGRGIIVAPGFDEGAIREAVGDELVANATSYARLYLTAADEGTTVATVGTQRAKVDSFNAGFYFGRPRITDGHSGDLKTFSPVGHIAADYLKALNAQGPGKAPAGKAFRIDFAEGIETRANGTPLVDEGIAETLMAQNINPIWDRDGTGPKVWGARAATSDPAWRFLHVAYIYNLISSEVATALDQLIYENASDPLFFSQGRQGIRNFMVNLHAQAAFSGIVPGDGEEPNPDVHAFAVQFGE